MRELSFRIWDKKEKTMFLSPIEIEHLGSWFDAHLSGAIADTGNKIVMQYTGIKDANGKKIFEGDIVKYNDRKEFIQTVITVPELGTGHYIRRPGAGYYTLNGSVVSEYGVEIIGNIHDNPELLEEELN